MVLVQFYWGVPQQSDHSESRSTSVHIGGAGEGVKVGALPVTKASAQALREIADEGVDVPVHRVEFPGFCGQQLASGQLRRATPMSTKFRVGRVRSTYEFIKANRGTFSVQMMCRLLGFAPSGYYALLAHPVSSRAQEDARLLRLIRASFTASQGIYGAPRIFS
jgi:hypothetical protein